MGVLLYVGADAQNLQRRRYNLTGLRCFSAAYGPLSRLAAEEASQVAAILDSGAFSDSPEDRLMPDEALQRQLLWEKNAERWWKCPWRAESLVSYDLLIDEKWTGGKRRKERWSVREADHAIRMTVDAAAYLAGQRIALAPRKLILACQGVDATQYEECVQGVLAHATPADWIGLGGWCILGRNRSWIPTFWTTMRRVLPRIASAGIARCHIFGVLYRPVLGGLCWLADQYGLTVSTDSSTPVLAVTWPSQSKAGAICSTWEANVAYWQDALANLRTSEYYREPPAFSIRRQLSFTTEE